MGLPNVRTKLVMILLSGTRIPTVFRFLKSLGRLLLPGSIKVYGPGRARFSILNVAVSIWRTKSERLLKSAQTKDQFAFDSMIPYIRAMRSKALVFEISHPSP